MIGLLSWFGFWERTYDAPRWVLVASDKYLDYYTRRFGKLPYGAVKYFRGRNYFYKVVYYVIGQGHIEDRFYVRKRWRD